MQLIAVHVALFMKVRGQSAIANDTLMLGHEYSKGLDHIR